MNTDPLTNLNVNGVEGNKDFNLFFQMILTKIDSMRELLEERLVYTNKEIETVRRDVSKYIDISQENSVAIHEIRTKIFSDISDIREEYKSIKKEFSDLSERIDNIESKLDINDGREMSSKKMFYIVAIITGIISLLSTTAVTILTKFIQ